MAFKLFHGKDGVVPLSRRPPFCTDDMEAEAAPHFDSFSEKWKLLNKKSKIIKKARCFNSGIIVSYHLHFLMQNCSNDCGVKLVGQNDVRVEYSSTDGDSSKHEASGNEWLETGKCPIAKSNRAVSGVLPLVASALRPPPGVKLKCPPAVVAARAALAKTALVKTLRPQPLPEKMLVIGVLGMAANVPLGIWREHTQKFSLPVHAAVPFIAMLRKSVLMPKTAMAFTIATSVLLR
ncbi:hypothetical protein RJ639_030400 [Escallonia herrerae]|uniref:Uncharacterized protein n=1 Tax=Escallonia herrerae TaxID=1293975 RepID=A0AA88X0F1_9ASTE|nr:hypothetical protein RJ639_030400 [Escallonia herrerae]